MLTFIKNLLSSIRKNKVLIIAFTISSFLIGFTRVYVPFLDASLGLYERVFGNVEETLNNNVSENSNQVCHPIYENRRLVAYSNGYCHYVEFLESKIRIVTYCDYVFEADCGKSSVRLPILNPDFRSTNSGELILTSIRNGALERPNAEIRIWVLNTLDGRESEIAILVHSPEVNDPSSISKYQVSLVEEMQRGHQKSLIINFHSVTRSFEIFAKGLPIETALVKNNRDSNLAAFCATIKITIRYDIFLNPFEVVQVSPTIPRGKC